MAKIKLGIGDYMVIRGRQGIKDLLKGVKMPYGKTRILRTLRNNIEGVTDDDLYMEIKRIKPRTYELNYISDSENSYSLDEEAIHFTPDWYDTSRFNDLIEVECYNELVWDFKEKTFNPNYTNAKTKWR